MQKWEHVLDGRICGSQIALKVYQIILELHKASPTGEVTAPSAFMKNTYGIDSTSYKKVKKVLMRLGLIRQDCHAPFSLHVESFEESYLAEICKTDKSILEIRKILNVYCAMMGEDFHSDTDIRVVPDFHWHTDIRVPVFAASNPISLKNKDLSDTSENTKNEIFTGTRTSVSSKDLIVLPRLVIEDNTIKSLGERTSVSEAKMSELHERVKQIWESWNEYVSSVPTLKPTHISKTFKNSTDAHVTPLSKAIAEWISDNGDEAEARWKEFLDIARNNRWLRNETDVNVVTLKWLFNPSLNCPEIGIERALAGTYQGWDYKITANVNEDGSLNEAGYNQLKSAVSGMRKGFEVD